MKTYTIIIADDNHDNIQLIVDVLESSGIRHKIIRAVNGKILCELAQKRCPDLIITDWEMPVMDGIEAIRILKDNMATRDIPVIMCTGRMTSSENLKMALESGAVDYIKKPIDKFELQARVYSMLKLSDSYRTIKEQNAILEQQNEEIQSQTEELLNKNIELEKLSIVASETANAVIIMDEEFNFEWLNEGFTKLYGITFDESTLASGLNLINESNYENIVEMTNLCRESKKPVHYETQINSKDIVPRWVHTTLTPIVDSSGRIKKYIAIDSDISELKQAEMVIRVYNKEIQMQTEEIIIQKNEIEKQHALILEKTELIKSSIQYAQTIQVAILPPQESIDRIGKNFIFYKPKDIVSGDFYWYAEVDNRIRELDGKSENYPTNTSIETSQFLAVVDCTGHGVPGAFMSMIANTLLNEIILNMRVYSPSLVLKHLQEKIQTTLHQAASNNDDGMDIGICRFEKQINETIVTYSGAILSLYYCKASDSKMKIIPGDCNSIGGFHYHKNSDFYDTTIHLKTNDYVLMFTDGAVSLMNDEGKKIGTNNFINRMEKNKNCPLIDQKRDLESLFNNQTQLDDITVIGIRLS